MVGSYLDAVEGPDDVHGGVVVLLRAALRLRLLRQLDQRARHALQLPDVLSALADDPSNLGRGHDDLHRQPHVLRPRHETFLSHFLEDQELCFPLSLWATDDCDLALLLSILGVFPLLVLLQRRYLDGSSAEPYNVANM